MLSVLSENRKMTEFLLARNIDIDAKNNAGDTALMLAAATGKRLRWTP
jgi:ankyrin repeat protein